MIEAHQNTNQCTPNDTRQRIVRAILDGEDEEVVSRLFNVKRWTVRRIMLKYDETGDSNKGKHGGHKKRLLTEEHCAFLREMISEDATVSLAYMRDQLESVDGLHVALSTVHKAIEGFGYSFKVLKKQAQAAVTPELTVWRSGESTVSGSQTQFCKTKTPCT